MLHTKPQGHWPFGSGEEDFWRVFYHIWVWRPSWSCDPDPDNKLYFPNPTGAPYEIGLWLAKQFWRRSLKMVDDGRMTTTMDADGQTDDGPLLYYKLTNEPKGSSELKISPVVSPPPCISFYGTALSQLYRIQQHFTNIIWAAAWQKQQNDLCSQLRLRSAWALSIGQSDQVFAVRMKKTWVFSFPLSAQQRL